MKKKWLIVLVVAIAICLSACHLNPKNADNLPSLENVIFMGQAEAEACIKGYNVNTLMLIWDEPTTADAETYNWECGSTVLSVSYKGEKVVSCGFHDAQPLLPEETVPDAHINHPQVMIDGKLYYYFGDGHKNDLPEGKPVDHIGAVKRVDNRRQPTEDWMAYRLPMGQVIAQDEDGNLYLVSGNSKLRLTCKS